MVNLKKLILKHTLVNARDYGKAKEGSVLGKVLAEYPKGKSEIPKIRKEIAKIVKKINSWSISKQKKELKKFGKIEKPEKEQRTGLPPLPSVKGKVITRFAPEPNGYLHLGHIKSAVLSFGYAKKYKGKSFLRFEDTNPKKEKKEYYDAIREDLEKFGLKFHKEVKMSDYMDKFYKFAEQLLKKGDLYVCTCPQETIGKMKYEKKSCDCREREVKDNLTLWKDMLNGRYKEGEIVIRLKTDMEAPNPAVRDPSLLRIVDTPHPLLGEKYKIYPMYNFACTVMDHLLKVSHVLRDKGFENDAQVQAILYARLGWTPPENIQFGRIKSIAGIPMKKRKILELFKRGELNGWDDLRIPNPRNLLKRGFQPQAIIKLMEEIGPSKNDITISWRNLENYNRQIIDKKSNRYFFVGEPVKIQLDRLVTKKVKAPIYPGKRTYRKLPITKTVFVDKLDFVANRGEEARLMHFCNVIIDKKAHVTGKPVKDIPKIHWVPSKNVPVTLVMPDGREIKGKGEQGLKKVKINETCQFERIGFCRKDKDGKFYFGHR